MEVECLALKDLTSPRKSFPEEDGGHGEQKENICMERRRSTPHKSTESPVTVLPMSRKGTTAPPDLVHITPIKHTALAEPWTPTANLKMLISAASPDIRDREMKKVLFRPIENEKPAASPDPLEDPEVEDSSQFEAAGEEEDGDKKPSRKQKSLGLLCQKFLALYPDYPPLHTPIWISLDEVATSLSVERRRIYDIVNVLESLMIVGRIAKNSYTWYGRLRLDATLEELQRRGRQQGYHLQVDLASEARGAVGGPGHEDDTAEGDAASGGGNRKDKSLRIMSQKFVMLFLVSKTQTVTLDAAAKILIEESQDSSSHSKYKTKVRRLYDIANVLTSLGLIKKVHVREERGRKPAFKWLGPVTFNNNNAGGNAVSSAPPEASRPSASLDLRRAKMARHASFNVTPTSAGVQRLVSSAPSSPRRDGLTNQPVDYSRKSSGNGAVCRLQFGTSTDPSGPPLPPDPRSPPPCLAYLPSLSQPSVVMLYRAPDQTPEGPHSPRLEADEGRKRRREEEEEEAVMKKKKGVCVEVNSDGGDGYSRISPQRQRASDERLSDGESAQKPSQQSQPSQPSHYLYVPNNAGLNGFNFLLSAGQTASGVSLPAGVALPYVLLPSAAISHYAPLVGGGLQHPQGPAHFMVGGVSPYGTPPSTPEQRLYVTGTPQSPSGPPHHAVCIATPETKAPPHTPKETTPSSSRAFFQTPGTLGNVSVAPTARRRGSAQRRLDVSHPPAV